MFRVSCFVFVSVPCRAVPFRPTAPPCVSSRSSPSRASTKATTAAAAHSRNSRPPRTGCSQQQCAARLRGHARAFAAARAPRPAARSANAQGSRPNTAATRALSWRTRTPVMATTGLVPRGLLRSDDQAPPHGVRRPLRSTDGPADRSNSLRQRSRGIETNTPNE